MTSIELPSVDQLQDQLENLDGELMVDLKIED